MKPSLQIHFGTSGSKISKRRRLHDLDASGKTNIPLVELQAFLPFERLQKRVEHGRTRRTGET